MIDLIPHRRQYLLTNHIAILPDSFNRVQLSGNWVLYYHKDLKVKEIYIDGEVNLILGEWLDVNFSKEITLAFEDNIIKHTYFFPGKWNIITHSKIYSDPTGLLGVYYSKFYDQFTEYNVYSSSPVLIAKVFPQCVKGLDERMISWGKSDGMEWFPPPSTKYIGINKLLASQVLDFTTGKIEPVSRFYFYDLKKLNYQQKIELTAKYLKSIVSEITRKWDNIEIALTSGNDSRLILSAFLCQDINVKTFTFHYKDIRSGDIRIPGRISKTFGLKHRIIYGNNSLNNENLEKLRKHNDGIVADGEELFVGAGHFDKLDLSHDTVLVRAGISDLFRLLYRHVLPENDDFKKDLSEKIMEAYHFRTKPVNSITGLRDWFRWHRDSNLYSGVDWRDIFYLEQRNGGWMSGNELTMDIFGFSTFQPMNSQFLIDLALSFNDEERDAKDYKHGRIQPDIIKYLYRDLLKFPINPTDYNLKIRNKFKRIFNSIFQG